MLSPGKDDKLGDFYVSLSSVSLREMRVYFSAAICYNSYPRDTRKYYGIGELLIAYGIKFSIDHGCRGDVVFDAKTDELAAHYERDFHAKRVASIGSGPKRYMLADEDSWRLFSKFLEEVPE